MLISNLYFNFANGYCSFHRKNLNKKTYKILQNIQARSGFLAFTTKHLAVDVGFFLEKLLHHDGNT